MAYQRQRCLMGYNSEGKPVYRYISGKTQDERDIEVVKAFVESGRINDYLPVTAPRVCSPKHEFPRYAWDWFCVYKKGNVSTKYESTLIGRLNRICDWFIDKNVEDVTTADIQRFFDSLSEMSESSIRYYRVALSMIFDSAIEDEIISKNPVRSKRLIICGKDTDGKKSLGVEECRRLIDTFPELTEMQRVCIGLMLFAGMRREEMLGLTWDDVDMEKRLIFVRRSVIMRNDGKPEIKSPKTKSSRRAIPMADILAGLLEDLGASNGFVVSMDADRPMNDREYKRFRNDIRRRTGFDDLGAIALRHTYATMSNAAGIDMKTIASCMGHSKIATTAEIYTQMEPVHAMDSRNAMVKFVCQNVQGEAE